MTTQDDQTNGAMAAEAPSHVVGIGASAGGLEALERFFEKMPVQTGLAFVVVQHLSPDFKSLMDELLARWTRIPLFRVENGMEVKANAIYLIPPKKDMILSDGQLMLTDKDPSQIPALPIDHFFRSLAQAMGDKSVGIVLSGTGSDGSRGIRDIHEAGGMVMVQSPETAKFDGMPRAAIQTGAAGVILPAEQIPDALRKYVEHPLDGVHLLANPQEPNERGLDIVFRLLREAYGVDFSLYKPSTVTRRLERRILLVHAVDLEAYIRLLREEPEELDYLYRDLLIDVTRFFRDSDAFSKLEDVVLPAVLPANHAEAEFRVWVAGCASGEEAYSLAMLVQERAERINWSGSIKIFATDVHQSSLEHASTGVYSEDALEGVSEERRRRFFLQKGSTFQVIPELRQLVVFAPHNIVKDAPFTKLDLVSCRNLLIYFQNAAQMKVISFFHFSLKTGGVMFLGPSEHPNELADEFTVVDSRWKLYRKRRNIRLPYELRLPATPSDHPVASEPRPQLPVGPLVPDHHLLGIYDALLESLMPPSLLVNEQRMLVQSFSGGGKYLRFRDGRYSADILDLVDAELRMALTGALHRANKEVKPTVYKGLRLEGLDPPTLINLTVRPIHNRRDGTTSFLITIEELGEAARTIAIRSPQTAEEINLQEASREQLQTIEDELRYTKENLQATIEELETSNEELQATNEELVASNEELQSTNEELHSVNEELYTVNAEYQKKITELTELTADMDNLLTSTAIHTLFLDRDLCIRKFTPRIAETFNLLPQDIGRRVDTFTHNIDHPTLLVNIHEVLDHEISFEKQVQDRLGNWYLLRILPYHSSRGIDGVVLTLVDINRVKEAEGRAARQEIQLTSILRNSPNLMYIKDREGRFVLVGTRLGLLFPIDAVGRRPQEFLPINLAEMFMAGEEEVLSANRPVRLETMLPQEGGTHTYLSIKFPLLNDQGELTGVGCIATDVTALKLAEQQARDAVAQRDRFLAMLSHELRNPLAAILNATRIIQQMGPVHPEVVHWFDIIERRSQHMSRLLDDLLDVSRLTQNRIEVRQEPVNLAKLVPDVLEEVQATFDEFQVSLHTVAPEDPVWVEGDANRLQQMQVNLLLNAAKHSGVGTEVRYRLKEQENQAIIEIEDTGEGIPEEMQERIFDLFVQGDRYNGQPNRGIGVGLTLAKRIAELHGGQIGVYSAGLSHGSLFTVQVPLQSKPAHSGAVDTLEPAQSAPQAHRVLQLLLIEDDTDNRESMCRLLELDGYLVRLAEDGPSGLAALLNEPPDVAVVDIALPGMTGYEVAQRAREQLPREKHPYFIALTGFGRASDREAASNAGFDSHFTKPLNVPELSRLLKRLAGELAN